MAFSHWDPLHDLFALQERIDRLSGQTSGWSPPVDLLETPDRYQIIAEVPGLTRDQVRIHVQHNTLTLEGERAAPQTHCEQYHRVERGHGRFSRAFRLTEPIASDRVTADLRDGVLTVTVPKARPASRRIDVGQDP